jgi:hypothetical protein
MQIQDAALLKRHIVPPEPQRGPETGLSGWQSGAAVFGMIAAAAGVSTLRSARPSMQAEVALEEMPPVTLEMGISEEFGSNKWDPLGLSDTVGEGTLRWFRHAELKHGRVCMLAFLGWANQVFGGHFQGYFDLDKQVSFASLSKLDFFQAWYGIPEKGRLQIIFLIGLVEWCTECTNPDGHYTKGGTPGDLNFLKYYPTIKVPAEKQAEFELAELKHGRLAMIGMASVFSAMSLPGSVPFLAGIYGGAA